MFSRPKSQSSAKGLGFGTRAGTPQVKKPERFDTETGRPIKTLHTFTGTNKWLTKATGDPEDLKQLLEKRAKTESPLIVSHDDTADVGVDPSTTRAVNYPVSGFSSTMRRPLPSSALELQPQPRPMTQSSGGRSGYQQNAVQRRTVSTPLARLPQLTSVETRLQEGADRRLRYFQWTESFEAERSAFKSINVWAELVLCQVMDATVGDPVPSPLRVAACSFVLEKLVAERASSGLPPAMAIIKTELLNAIYLNHKVDLTERIARSEQQQSRALTTIGGRPSTVKSETNRGLTPSDMLSSISRAAGQFNSFERDDSATGQNVPTYIDMKLYSMEVERLQSQLKLKKLSTPYDSDAYAAKRLGSRDIRPPLQVVAVLNGAMKSTQKYIKRVVFKAWRAQVTRSTPEDVAGMWAKMALQSSGKQMLQHYYRRWRSFPETKRGNDRAHRLQLIVENLRREINLKDNIIADLEHKLKSRPAIKENASSSPADGGLSSAHSSNRDMQRHRSRGSTSPTPGEAFIGEHAPHHTMDVENTEDLEPSSPSHAGDTPFVGVERIDPDKALVVWCNTMLRRSMWSHLHLVDIASGLVDGKIYVALVATIYPRSAIDSSMDLESAIRRVEDVIYTLRNNGLPDGFVDTADIMNGTVANIALLGWLFARWYYKSLVLLEELHDIDLNKSTTDVEELALEFEVHRQAPQAFHILSQRIENHVQRVLLSKVRETRGGSNAQVVADLAEFTVVPPSALAEVELEIPVHEEVGRIGVVIRNHYTDLRKIYEFYRSTGQPNQGMPMPLKGFLRFVEDTKLTSRNGISKQFLLGALAGAKIGGHKDDGGSSSPPPPSALHLNVKLLAGVHNRSLEGGRSPNVDSSSGSQPAMSPRYSTETVPQEVTKAKFSEVLVRASLVHILSQGKVLTKGIVADTLQDIITTQILPRAMSNPKAEFKRICSDQKLQDVFANPILSKALSRIYRHYSTVDSHGKASMTKRHFVQMLMGLQLVDKSMKEKDITSIFSEVQDEDVTGPDAEGESMSMGEFHEALTAIAMFRFPHPLQPVPLRVQTFLNTVLIPASKTVVKR